MSENNILLILEIIVGAGTIISLIVMMHRAGVKWSNTLTRIETKFETKLDHLDNCIHRVEERIEDSDKARAKQFEYLNNRIDNLRKERSP